MATQVRTFSMPMAASSKSSGGIVAQISRLLLQPVAFFRAMPTQRQWMLAALAVLFVTGYMATTQVSSSTLTFTTTESVTTSLSSTNNGTSSTFPGGMAPPTGDGSFTPPTGDTSTSSSEDTSSSTATNSNSSTRQSRSSTSADSTDSTTTAGTGGFDLSLFDASSTEMAALVQTDTATSEALSTDEALMNALLAASGILVIWIGQTVLLSLVSMFRGQSPQIAKSFQIAVWASLPLALMLILRYVHFATGGSGGELGLSLLLNNWAGFSELPEFIQRITAVFFSNLTLFWLWNILLLYLGARYALGGRRFIAVPLVALWIIGSTLIPAIVTEPTNEIAPREIVSTSVSTSDDSSSTTSSTTTTTQSQQLFSGGSSSSSGFPSGNFSPPSGGPPGG
ncbi:MAG: hypothetical protein KC615_03375 [Anaerolineae bacterium]|nr:hypothetical protein [Anaerolineae bacterium]